jgi:hypothetical protein
MGCTTLREVPRAEYAARPERRHVTVDTREGTHYEFEFARVANDTLTGYRPHDSESSVEDYDLVPLALEDITKISAHRIDWYRTGLIGGAGVLAVVGTALANRKGGSAAANPCPNPKCFQGF